MATRKPPQISIRKVRLNAGGYAPGRFGRYYGNVRGTSIYQVDGAFLSLTVRATNRAHAAVVALLTHDTFGSQRDSADWQNDRAALVTIGVADAERRARVSEAMIRKNRRVRVAAAPNRGTI